MFVPEQRPLNYYSVHNAYQLKSACSRNQNSKASIKWKMRSRHKIIPTNIKGFWKLGLEALVLFHRILCRKKHFYSAFNFPTIFGHRIGLCCKVSERRIAAVSPPALKWKSISGHVWCDHSPLVPTLQPCPELFFLVCFGLQENSLNSIEFLLNEKCFLLQTKTGSLWFLHRKQHHAEQFLQSSWIVTRSLKAVVWWGKNTLSLVKLSTLPFLQNPSNEIVNGDATLLSWAVC